MPYKQRMASYERARKAAEAQHKFRPSKRLTNTCTVCGYAKTAKRHQ